MTRYKISHQNIKDGKIEELVNYLALVLLFKSIFHG